MGRSPFTEAKRGRFLGLIEAGRSVEDACAALPLSPDTLYRWLRDGRQADAGEKADFAAAYDALKAAPATTRMTESDLIHVLEVQARRGSVPAVRLLLTRPWERATAERPKAPPVPASVIDQLAARRRPRPS